MIGKRSKKLMEGMTPVALPTVDALQSWRNTRKRFVYIPGKPATLRDDPEFGSVPYQRKFGVNRSSEAVEMRNKIMQTCAGLVDKIFVDKDIVVEIPTKYGTKRKIVKRVKVIEGTDKVANRDAVRAAFSLCLVNNGNVTEDQLKNKALEFAKEEYDKLVAELRQKAEVTESATT